MSLLAIQSPILGHGTGGKANRNLLHTTLLSPQRACTYLSIAAALLPTYLLIQKRFERDRVDGRDAAAITTQRPYLQLLTYLHAVGERTKKLEIGNCNYLSAYQAPIPLRRDQGMKLSFPSPVEIEIELSVTCGSR